MMRRLPAYLVALRAVLGPLVLVAAWRGMPRGVIIAAMAAAFVSDIFDGVVARRIGVVTEKLRVADSRVDLIYYICIAAAIWRTHPEIVEAYRVPLAAIILFQVLSWGVDLVKFGRIASFHAYMAKAWGLSLFVASVSILGFGQTGPFLWIAIVIGFIGNIEGIAMVCILPEWQHDVLSLRHALRIRQSYLENRECREEKQSSSR